MYRIIGDKEINNKTSNNFGAALDSSDKRREAINQRSLCTIIWR